MDGNELLWFKYRHYDKGKSIRGAWGSRLQTVRAHRKFSVSLFSTSMLAKATSLTSDFGPVYNSGMTFSEQTVRAVWARAEGRCECQRTGHGHKDRCTQELTWSLQSVDVVGGWRARRKATWGRDTLENCEIRCSSCQRSGVYEGLLKGQTVDCGKSR